MKNLLRFAFLAPLAVAAVACGDDSSGSGGAGGSSSDATTTSTTTTSTTTSTTSTTTSTTTSSSAGGGGGGDVGGGTAQGGGGGGTVDTTPIDAPADTWTWVDFPDSRCINDTPTGIGVNVSPSNDEDVVIFLQGGNACFNTATCFITAHTDGFDEATFDEEIADVGSLDLFTRGAQNPIGDWSWAYVPYCTGDVHAGDNQGVQVGGQERNFRGFRNMSEYLARLVPTFPNAKRVLLTGVSAGGFGAAYNYDQVKRAFGDGVEVILIDDSGPPMAEEYIPACLQGKFKELWGLNNTLPQGCADCLAGDTFTEEYLSYEFSEFPDQRFAIISSSADATISAFWSFGNDDCSNVNGGPGSYAPEKFQAGLEDIRDRIAANANFALFMPTSDRHVWVNDAEGLSTTVDGSPTLLDWIGQTLNDDPEWQSWPAP